MELGGYTKESHREVGRLLAEEGYSAVFTFGEAAKYIAKAATEAGVPIVKPCTSHMEMANEYLEMAVKGDVILVKGSRGLRMERVVQELKER